MLKIWNDHHSCVCVQFRDRGKWGLPVPLHQSTGATIVVQGSRDLFLLFIPIWCDIQASLVCQVRRAWTTVPCVLVSGIGVEVEVLS